MYQLPGEITTRRRWPSFSDFEGFLTALDLHQIGNPNQCPPESKYKHFFFYRSRLFKELWWLGLFNAVTSFRRTVYVSFLLLFLLLLIKNGTRITGICSIWFLLQITLRDYPPSLTSHHYLLALCELKSKYIHSNRASLCMNGYWLEKPQSKTNFHLS